MVHRISKGKVFLLAFVALAIAAMLSVMMMPRAYAADSSALDQGSPALTQGNAGALEISPMADTAAKTTTTSYTWLKAGKKTYLWFYRNKKARGTWAQCKVYDLYCNGGATELTNSNPKVIAMSTRGSSITWKVKSVGKATTSYVCDDYAKGGYVPTKHVGKHTVLKYANPVKSLSSLRITRTRRSAG